MNITDQSSSEVNSLAFAETIGGARSSEIVVDNLLLLAQSFLSNSAVAFYRNGTESDLATELSPQKTTDNFGNVREEAVSLPVVRSVIKNGQPQRRTDLETKSLSESEECATTDIFLPVGGHGVLRVEPLNEDHIPSGDLSRLTQATSAATAALDRLIQDSGADEDEQQRTVEFDADSLDQVYQPKTTTDSHETIVTQLLSLGQDYVGLDTGILTKVENSTIDIMYTVGSTTEREKETTYDISDQLCEATLNQDLLESISFADASVEDYGTHPASENSVAYIGVPVFVDGELYGTINFTSSEPRSETFDRDEHEFINLLAQRIGIEIEHQNQLLDVERYETILQAVDDPVYALDANGKFTFVNDAAEREFGYGEDVIGADPSVGMDENDIAHIQSQIDDLITTDQRSKRSEFELKSRNGEPKIVENRIALIGENEFRGTAGVLRDVTSRKERERQLASFQRAIEQGADGVAILDDEEYVYVDDTHVEMYGFDNKDQLIGSTWHTLYDDSEISRLEAEALPAVESDGHWRGQVTGQRPDGTSFPTEISLTLIDDGRIVCTARDETEQRRQQRELKLFQQAIEQAADGVAVLKDDKYTYIDKTHIEMYGFESKEELLGDSWRRLYDDAEIERFETEVFPALEADGHWRGPVTGTQPDGTTFPAELSLTIIDDGRLVCTVRDETDRKERERELELKERAMDEASVAIQIADATKDDNPLVYVNDGFEQITGYEPEEVLGQNPRFLQGDDTDPESRQRLREAISREEPVSLDIQNYRKDGTPYWSQLSITPVTDKHGTVENYIGIQQDITERREREQKLLAERERFRLLIESVDEYAFLAINEDGQIQTWNESAKQLFGYTDESALGMDVATLHPPADRKSKIPERLLQQAKFAGKSSHEGWRVTADGDQFYADTRYVRLENDEGTSHGYAQIVRDMTERRQQRRRTERFVEESEDVIAIVGTDGTFSYVSGSAQAVLAYDPNEMVGENIFDYVYETEREQLMQTFFATVESTDADQQAECRFKSGNDDWLNIELQCRNMLDDDAIDGMLLYLRDVTDSKQRARRFESIFNQTFQFAGLLEPDGTVIEVNDSEIIPASDQSDGIAGDLFHETPFWTHSETVQNKVQDAITQARKGETVRFKTEMQDASGLATVDLSIKPVITGEGDISVLVAEGRDITDQQHRRQHIDVIHRVMRHNMRNDLSKLRGWAQQMSEEPEPSTRAEHLATLERIFDKWESMTDRVKQIRQASRQSNKVAGVNPGSLIEDAVAPINEQYPTATISTDISVDASTQVPAILLDAVRELVENAAKADTDATINLEVTPAENEWVELCVCDDGPGLPEIEAHALETGNETDLDHGQGLGLWMVRMITTQVGGDISVELNEKGTEINLHIPTK